MLLFPCCSAVVDVAVCNGVMMIVMMIMILMLAVANSAAFGNSDTVINNISIDVTGIICWDLQHHFRVMPLLEV